MCAVRSLRQRQSGGSLAWHRQARHMVKTKPLIAVVDDDPSIVKTLVRTLRTAGYEVEGFGSAREFLASVGEAMPECLVLDVHMPEMTGVELESRLRGLGHPVPVIFITANDTPQARAAVGRGHNVSLILKPFHSATLLTAVNKAVATSGN